MVQVWMCIHLCRPGPNSIKPPGQVQQNAKTFFFLQDWNVCEAIKTSASTKIGNQLINNISIHNAWTFEKILYLLLLNSIWLLPNCVLNCKETLYCPPWWLQHLHSHQPSRRVPFSLKRSKILYIYILSLQFRTQFGKSQIEFNSSKYNIFLKWPCIMDRCFWWVCSLFL